ncbi:MAG: hypothetical protein CL831_04675 [Crocinitomicaceae bacterium]|nr:hypothetical protein [Crocinitomicaceae bacterium]
MKHKNKISRRHFIGTTGCAAMGSTAFLSSFTTLGMMNSLAPSPPPDDYKALVCILLAGGNDSYNMVVPTSAEPYNVYANTRSNLALPQGGLLPLDYTDASGINYGLNPAMPEVANMFNSGRAAVIANVGTLIEPVTKSQILSGAAPVPLGLKSHSDQARHWQTSVPQSRNAKGWGGKVADILASGNSNQDMSMNLSLAGTNLWQAGNTVDEFTITPQGSVGVNVLNNTDALSMIIGEGVSNIMDQQYADILKQTYANKVNASQNQHNVFTAAISDLNPLSTEFANNQFSKQMKMVAKSIAVSGSLGMERQTYYLKLGGFDTHGEVINNQAAKLSLLSAAIGSFYEAMDELGISEKVTTFTISDFARTLTSNGGGSDHGWGGHSMVFGGAVNGGQFYGQYPSLDIGGNLDIGNGVLIPEISTDQYFSELALWMGVSPSDLPNIFPNLENFYTPGVGTPIGFMNF